MVVGLGSRSRRGRMGADDGIIYIVTPVRSESLSAPRQVRVSLSLYIPPLLSYSIHRLLPAPILTSVQVPPLCFTFFVLFAFHVRLRDGGSRFMRSLSIFHDSVFYCLYESFYPAFLPAV